MTESEYLAKSASIKIRIDILRKQIDNHVTRYGNTNSPLVRPLIDRQQDAIDELIDLDKQYFNIP